MGYDTARQQHIEWLQKQIEEKKLACVEVEALVAQLRADIEYFELMLNIHEEANADAMSQDSLVLSTSNESSHKKTTQSQTNNHTSTVNLKNHSQHLNKRSPKETLRDEFRSKTLAEVAEVILNSRNEALSADDIAQTIFLTKDDEEYERARNSLSTELRRGAKEGKWKQVRRGYFASNSVDSSSRGSHLVLIHASDHEDLLITK